MIPEDPTFTVYLSQPLKGEFALVIITHEKRDDSFITEFFASVHSDVPKNYGIRYEHKDARFLEEKFGYVIDDARDDTLVRAQSALDGYILEKYEETKDLYYATKSFELKKVPRYRLISYHVGGLFEGMFEAIVKQTLCEPLRAYLTKVLEVPPFKEYKYRL